MNYILLILSILILFNRSKGLNETINLGASTSGLQQQLSDTEKFEIEGFVDNFLNTLADERNNVRLHPNEMSDYLLETQILYFSAIGDYLTYGSTYGVPNGYRHTLPNHEARRRYYDSIIRSQALETLIDSCMVYFRKLSREVLNNFSSTILRNVPNSSQNLANRKRKKTSTSRMESSDTDSSKDTQKSEKIKGLKTSEYNVIPLQLILRFFEEWSDSFNMIPNFHECANVGGFAHVAVSFSSSNDINSKDQFLANDTNLDDLRQNLLSLIIHGNTFRGPRPHMRAPSMPQFFQRYVGLMLSFEIDCATIIGLEHYQELLPLFKRLIDYVGMNPEETNPIDRYTAGLELYISMMTTFSSYETVPMNIDQWEEREMTERELSRFTEEERNMYRGVKYWMIKKSFRRPKRSVMKKEKIGKSTDLALKERWSKFIVYLMSAFLQTGATEVSTPWSDDFARLYLEYKSKSLLDSEDECSNKNFDTFLYLKISRISEWSTCVRSRSKDSFEWCMAWKRLLFTHKLNTGGSWKKLKSKKFHQDLKTLMNWLKEKIYSEKKKTGKYGFMIRNGDPNQLLFPKDQRSLFLKVLSGILKPFGGSRHNELRRR